MGSTIFDDRQIPSIQALQCQNTPEATADIPQLSTKRDPAWRVTTYRNFVELAAPLAGYLLSPTRLAVPQQTVHRDRNAVGKQEMPTAQDALHSARRRQHQFSERTAALAYLSLGNAIRQPPVNNGSQSPTPTGIQKDRPGLHLSGAATWPDPEKINGRPLIV